LLYGVAEFDAFLVALVISVLLGADGLTVAGVLGRAARAFDGRLMAVGGRKPYA